MAGTSSSFLAGSALGPYPALSDTASSINLGANGAITKRAHGTATILNATKVITVTLPGGFSFASSTSYTVVVSELQDAGSDATGQSYAVERISGTQFKIHSDGNVGSDSKIAFACDGQ